jgi:predicted neuraminidase
MRSDPSIVQTADGAIHVVYTWKKHRLKHVVIDEGWVRHPRCPVVLLKGL